MELYDGGKRVQLPDEIGIPGGQPPNDAGATCLYWIHVHASTPNIVHIESPVKKTLTVGDLLAVWERTKSSATPGGDTFVVKLRAAAKKGQVHAFYNGKSWTRSYTAIPLTSHAVIALAIILERVIYLFFRASINKEGFLRGLKKYIYAGDLDKAINYVAGQKATPLTNVIKAGLMNVPKGDEEVQAALDEAHVSLRLIPGGEINLREDTPLTKVEALVSYGMFRRYVLIDLWAESLPAFFAPGGATTPSRRRPPSTMSLVRKPSSESISRL